LLSLIIGNLLNWNYLYFVWIFCVLKYKFFVLFISINSILIFFLYKKTIFYKKIIALHFIFILVKVTFFINLCLLSLKKIVNYFLEKRFLEIYERNNFIKILNLNNIILRKNYLLYFIIIFIIRFFFFLM
jgi:hypothetical protein